MHYDEIVFCLFGKEKKSEMLALGYDANNSMLNKGEIFLSHNRTNDKPEICEGTALPSFANPDDYPNAPYLSFNEQIKLQNVIESSVGAGDGWALHDV